MNLTAKFLLILMVIWPVSLIIAYFISNNSLLGFISILIVACTLEVVLLSFYLSEKEDPVDEEEYKESGKIPGTRDKKY